MQIRELRIRKGLSQKELADILKVAQPSVYSWESGRSAPSAKLLPALAAALGCSIDDLFRPAPGRDAAALGAETVQSAEA